MCSSKLKKIFFKYKIIITENVYLTYYQKNKESILAKTKEYYQKNKERLSAQAKEKYRSLSEEK